MKKKVIKAIQLVLILMEVFKKQIPLFALESQDPIKDFDFLGITIQYEMCYTNILQVLHELLDDLL